MKFKLLLLFVFMNLSLAGQQCDTFDGTVFDCECCISGYPYDYCQSANDCSHFLAWVLSIWGVCVLGFLGIYCYARHKFSTRIQMIQDRARIASAEKSSKEPGVQKTQYVDTNQTVQTLEVTQDQL